MARGGPERHGREVLAAAHAESLSVVECCIRALPVRAVCSGPSPRSIRTTSIHITSHVEAGCARRVLFRSADVVLANSIHEPFGLVGLEAMGAGGLACTGSSGEDYAQPGRNALVLETRDPEEFLGLFAQLRLRPTHERRIRAAGRATARHYAWREIVQGVLLPRVRLLGAGAAPGAPGHHAGPRSGRHIGARRMGAERPSMGTRMTHRIDGQAGSARRTRGGERPSVRRM